MTSLGAAIRIAKDRRQMPAFPPGDIGALARALNLSPPVSIAKGLIPALNALPFAVNLWTAFIANNAGDAVLVSSSPNGTSWTGNTNIGQSSKFAPTLAFFNNRLYVAFIANNSG